MLCKTKSGSKLWNKPYHHHSIKWIWIVSQFSKQSKIFVEIYPLGLTFVMIVSSISEVKESRRTSFELQKIWKETVGGGITVLWEKHSFNFSSEGSTEISPLPLFLLSPRACFFECQRGKLWVKGWQWLMHQLNAQQHWQSSCALNTGAPGQDDTNSSASGKLK